MINFQVEMRETTNIVAYVHMYIHMYAKAVIIWSARGSMIVNCES